MVSRDDERFVIWPIYFNKSISRLAGRRVSKKIAAEKYSIEDIAKVAKALGLNPVLEKDVAHPSCSWKKDGRIIVDKKGSKSKILAQISKQLS